MILAQQLGFSDISAYVEADKLQKVVELALS